MNNSNKTIKSANWSDINNLSTEKLEKWVFDIKKWEESLSQYHETTEDSRKNREQHADDLKNNLLLSEKEKNIELYEKLKTDIENEKIGQHGCSFSSVRSFLEHGILSPLQLLKKFNKYPHKYPEYYQSNAMYAWETYFCTTIKDLVDKYGPQYIKEHFDSLPWPVGDGVSEYERNKYKKMAYKTIGELKNKGGPRIKYFLEKIVPPLLDYYLKYGEWENGKIRKDDPSIHFWTEDSIKNTKLGQAINIFTAYNLISSTPPQGLKDAFLKRKDASYSGSMTILFDVPKEILTHHVRSEIYESSPRDYDLGISSAIKPHRFRAIMLWGEFDESNNSYTFPVSSEVYEKRVKEEDELRSQMLRKLWYSHENAIEREELYLNGMKEIIKNDFMKLKQFCAKKNLPILGTNYNLISDPNSILLKFVRNDSRHREKDLFQFKWSEL